MAKRLNLYFFRRLRSLKASILIIRSLFISQKQTLSLGTLIVIVKNGWLWIIVVQAILMILVAIIVVVIVCLPHITPHELGGILRGLVSAGRLPSGITEVHFYN